MKKKKGLQYFIKGAMHGVGIILIVIAGCYAWRNEKYILSGILIMLAAVNLVKVFFFAYYTEYFLDALGEIKGEQEEKAFGGWLRHGIKKERELQKQMEENAAVSSSAMLLKREAELHALQNQINPHFLYNTLEIIRSKALVCGVDDVAEMTEALGTLFRYYINRPGELATIEEELDNVRNYILIQKYRFPNRFEFGIKVEDEESGVLNRLIPVLTIQPMVENAISHGLANYTEGGHIWIHVHLCDDDQLYIIIMDNGVGIDEETLIKMRHRMQNPAMDMNINKIREKSPGIALDNVNRRIRFYFGEEYGIEIQSTLGVGTNVVVRLPNIVM
ncbi:sensor histidine kinase [Lachnospiraceae bacterium]|nr:sensor histidine kinase [Lachnospiraceae bacterium]